MGGDGGYLNTLTLDGVTYTFNPVANTVTADKTTTNGGKAVVIIFNTTTHELAVNTDLGGKFSIDLDAGSYVYAPNGKDLVVKVENIAPSQCWITTVMARPASSRSPCCRRPVAPRLTWIRTTRPARALELAPPRSTQVSAAGVAIADASATGGVLIRTWTAPT